MKIAVFSDLHADISFSDIGINIIPYIIQIINLVTHIEDMVQ